MKKVLILAYDFPPYNSIASQRPASWLKYLPEHNIDVTIITRHWDTNIQSPIDYIKPSINKEIQTEIISEKARIIRVPFEPNLRDRIILKYGMSQYVFLRKVLSFILSYIKFFSKYFDETYAINKAAKQYLATKKADIIIATGEPFVLFKHAHQLSKNKQIKWIADYRDCWTNVPKQNDTILTSVQNFIFSIIEKKIIETASLITTASPTYKELLQKLHSTKKIQVVLNGHDIESFYLLNNIQSETENFEIAYAGILYPHQQVEMFLEGLSLFIKKNQGVKIKVIFYGIEFYKEMKSRIIEYDATLLKYLFFTPRISYNEVLMQLKKSHALLLLTDEGANWLNAKVFDYLAMQKPILLVKNDKGILEQLLDENNVGYKASTAAAVSENLKYIYDEYFLINKNHSANTAFEKYSRKKQAEEFANTLLAL